MNKSIEIKDHEFPIRLDRFIRTIDPFITQGVIEQYMRKGLIKVNGIKAEASTRVSNGDVIGISDKIADTIQPRTRKPAVKNSVIVEALAKKLLTEYLLYDSPYFLAINKPAGLSTQGGTKINLSLDDALVLLSSKGFDLRLVHRLDKDTSGVILIAKSRNDADKFMNAFQKHKIHKTYMAILSSIPSKHSGKIQSYLIKERDFEVSSYETEIEGSKLAITEYEVVSTKDGKSLVRFNPLTGRMHQLRVHSKLIGCSIVGDDKYGGAEASNLMLHAAEVTIDEDIFGEKITIKSPLPGYFL